MPSYLRFTPFTSGAAVRRRLTVLCALAGLACGGAPGPQSVSPQSMNQTLDQFFAAVKANDLQRMGALWGTERGPANDWMKSDELRQRLSVIQRYLAHVGYRVIEGPLVVPGNLNQRSFRVELQRATDRKSTRLNSSHSQISYAVFCLKKKKKTTEQCDCPQP